MLFWARMSWEEPGISLDFLRITKYALGFTKDSYDQNIYFYQLSSQVMTKWPDIDPIPSVLSRVKLASHSPDVWWGVGSGHNNYHDDDDDDDNDNDDVPAGAPFPDVVQRLPEQLSISVMTMMTTTAMMMMTMKRQGWHKDDGDDSDDNDDDDDEYIPASWIITKKVRRRGLLQTR